MPRSKEFQEDKVLSRAMELFWERGFSCTSVQDLVDRMGINRFSIYSTFGDKEGLFLAALDRYAATVVDQRLREMETGPGGCEAIRDYFELLVECYARPDGWRGCLMINSAIEMGALDGSEAGKKIRAYTERLERALKRSIEIGIRGGEIPEDRSSQELAGFLVSQVLGLGVLAKTRPGKELLRSRVDTALVVLGTNSIPHA